eukprot:CAMPEP_0194206820 /NCGR_PEP_ID=MMETSP0156-20130528/5750_1 /TAXON_ID=33649 /ORGANISM="Thalassionema nitzschioides, Strain L26-B" /LENGTH=237 /DNA_ID=CAMNT_0038933439 /DNA_START=167 /DNA_END=880 /DNA_ORIENTATION=+
MKKYGSHDANKKTSSSALVPNSGDVLLGRKANAFNHPGNQRYRHLITLSLPKYRKLLENKLLRSSFMKQLLNEILDGGRVRFLRLDNKSGQCTQVPNRTAEEKVAHALRDGVSKATFGLDNHQITKVHGSIHFDERNIAQEIPPLIRTPSDTYINLSSSGEDYQRQQSVLKTIRKHKAANNSEICHYAALQNIARLKAIEELKAKTAFFAFMKQQQAVKQLQQNERMLLLRLAEEGI